MPAQTSFDELDLKVLSELLGDARKPYKEIARKLGVSTSTIFFRVRNLIKSGVIKGFRLSLDLERLGYDITVAIFVKVSGGKLMKVEEQIARMSPTTAVYDITGEWDALVLAKFKTRAELNHFVKKLLAMPYVEHTCTYTVLNTVKEDEYADLLK